MRDLSDIPGETHASAEHAMVSRAHAGQEFNRQLMQRVDLTQIRTAQHWYVAYTLPRHEKSIAHRLAGGDVTCYVPLYSETRSWKERKVQLELPLFPCYVFVRMHLEMKAKLLSVPGVVRLLAASGSAAIFPDQEMEALQSSLKQWRARPYPFHSSGKRVRLRTGPFAGLEGTIKRRNGKRALIVNLDLIQSSMLVEIDSADAQLCM